MIEIERAVVIKIAENEYSRSTAAARAGSLRSLSDFGCRYYNIRFWFMTVIFYRQKKHAVASGRRQRTYFIIVINAVRQITENETCASGSCLRSIDRIVWIRLMYFQETNVCLVYVHFTRIDNVILAISARLNSFGWRFYFFFL